MDKRFRARRTYLVQRWSELKTRTNKREGYKDRLCVGMLGNIGALPANDDAADGDIAVGTTAQSTETGNAVPVRVE